MARNVISVSLNDDYVQILDYIAKVFECDRSEALRCLMRNFVISFCPDSDEFRNIKENYAKLLEKEADLGLSWLKNRFQFYNFTTALLTDGKIFQEVKSFENTSSKYNDADKWSLWCKFI